MGWARAAGRGQNVRGCAFVVSQACAGQAAENLMLLNLIKAYVEEKREDAFFLFLDMEKAFDRCSWD